jgi:hypothetical protein
VLEASARQIQHALVGLRRCSNCRERKRYQQPAVAAGLHRRAQGQPRRERELWASPSHFPPSLWTKQSRQGSCRSLTKFAMSIPSPPDSSHSWNHNLPISIPNQSQGTAELHSDGNHRSRVRRLFELHGWLGGTREGGA